MDKIQREINKIGVKAMGIDFESYHCDLICVVPEDGNTEITTIKEIVQRYTDYKTGNVVYTLSELGMNGSGQTIFYRLKKEVLKKISEPAPDWIPNSVPTGYVNEE